jgi:hypothetical protein
MTQTLTTTIDRLKSTLVSLNEGIEYAEVCDTTYTRYYTYLLRERKNVWKTLKRLEKVQKKEVAHGKRAEQAVKKAMAKLRQKERKTLYVLQ